MKVFRQTETGDEQIGDLYAEDEVQEKIKEANKIEKERIDYEVCKIKEEFSKELNNMQTEYREKIKALQNENEFYKSIIKSVLHI